MSHQDQPIPCVRNFLIPAELAVRRAARNARSDGSNGAVVCVRRWFLDRDPLMILLLPIPMGLVPAHRWEEYAFSAQKKCDLLRERPELATTWDARDASLGICGGGVRTPHFHIATSGSWSDSWDEAVSLAIASAIGEITLDEAIAIAEKHYGAEPLLRLFQANTCSD